MRMLLAQQDSFPDAKSSCKTCMLERNLSSWHSEIVGACAVPSRCFCDGIDSDQVWTSAEEREAEC